MKPLHAAVIGLLLTVVMIAAAGRAVGTPLYAARAGRACDNCHLDNTHKELNVSNESDYGSAGATTISWPVTKLEPSLAKNRATLATSSAVPVRRKGVIKRHLRANSGSGSIGLCHRGVWIRPGQMQFTLMPFGPNVFAIRRVRPTIPAFAAQ